MRNYQRETVLTEMAVRDWGRHLGDALWVGVDYPGGALKVGLCGLRGRRAGETLGGRGRSGRTEPLFHSQESTGSDMRNTGHRIQPCR